MNEQTITKDDLLSLAAALRKDGEHGRRCTEDSVTAAEYAALIHVAEAIEEWVRKK